MSYVFQVPDDLYKELAEYASERGQTVDELLLAYVRQAIDHERNRETGTADEGALDPLAPFIGAFTFGVGDLAENHDQYLAQSYMDSADTDE